MLTRCMELLAAMVLVAFFAAAPAMAHEGSHGEAAVERAFTGDSGLPAVSPEAQSIERPSVGDGHAHLPGCTGCCACSGGGCQSMMTLPFGAEYALPPLLSHIAVPEAAGPPRRLQRSLEHPPKSFA